MTKISINAFIGLIGGLIIILISYQYNWLLFGFGCFLTGNALGLAITDIIYD